MHRTSTEMGRVYATEQLDGFYVDTTLDRCLHFTFEEHDVLVLDVFNTARAAYAPVGEALSTIELNVRTGQARVFVCDR